MAVTEVDDKVLVEAHKAGDPDAFRAIVDAYRPALYGHALRRLGDPAAAEDVVQETLLRAYRALPRFNGQYRLSGWLHRILTNVCIDEWARRQREADVMGRYAAHPASVAPGVEQALSLDLPTAEVNEALERLPDTHREALLLRVVDGLPYAEVADRAGVTEDNARARVSRARSAMRTLLQGAVAAIVFVLPFTRRQQQAVASNGDVASTVASSGSAVTSAASPAASISSHLSPLAGAAAQVGDVAASGGMAVAGKVAVAVSVVAAVAVPTGAVISNRATASPPPAAPAAVGPRTAAPASAPTAEVAVLSSSAPTATTALTDGGTVSSATTTTVVAAATSTMPTTATSTPAGSPAPAPTEEPAPAPAGPGGTFQGDGLFITDSGPRLEISGVVTLDNGHERISGDVGGKLLVGDADPKDASAPRRLDGTLAFAASDGRVAELRLVGSVVVTELEGGGRSYQLEGQLRVSGDDLGIGTDGVFEALVLRQADNRGTIELVVNGGPPESATSTTSTTAASSGGA